MRPWTEDEVALARLLASQCKSAEEIAQALGRTRNAVLTKADRGAFTLLRSGGSHSPRSQIDGNGGRRCDEVLREITARILSVTDPAMSLILDKRTERARQAA